MNRLIVRHNSIRGAGAFADIRKSTTQKHRISVEGRARLTQYAQRTVKTRLTEEIVAGAHRQTISRSSFTAMMLRNEQSRPFSNSQAAPCRTSPETYEFQMLESSGPFVIGFQEKMAPIKQVAI
jgi:hypothetical protein